MRKLQRSAAADVGRARPESTTPRDVRAIRFLADPSALVICDFASERGFDLSSNHQDLLRQLFSSALLDVAIDPDVVNVLLVPFHCLPIKLHTNVVTNGANRPVVHVQFTGANVAVD